MPAESHNLPEQEISIKARSHELFVKSGPDLDTRSVKPFPVYLRETPAIPISGAVKALLWIVAIVVALLFIAAVWRLIVRHGTQRQRAPARPRAAPASSCHAAIDQPVNHRALPAWPETAVPPASIP